MTAEMQSLANDPNFVVEFAIGEPFPQLVPQQKGSGIVFSGVYFDRPKRYIMKKAHMSREDVRILDVDNGRVVMVSHHPGKNPVRTVVLVFSMCACKCSTLVSDIFSLSAHPVPQ
jgi:hypothetical protein